MNEMVAKLFSLILFYFISLINCESYTPPDEVDKMGFAYEFKINIDPGKEECFFQMVQQHSTLYVAFQVMRGGDGKAGFSIRTPAGAVVLPYQWQASSEYDEQSVEVGGYYQFCIDNSLSPYTSKLVSMYAASYKRDEWEKYMQDLTAADVTVANFTSTLAKVDQNIGAMLKYLDHSRRHLTHDWYLVEGNSNYVKNWSIFQCLIIVATSVSQVFLVKRYFTVDEGKGLNKPRA